MTSPHLGVSLGPTTSASSACPAQVLQNSAQSGEGHRPGSSHPQLIFLCYSPAVPLPEAMAELLPRKLVAAGHQPEESHQVKARNRGISVDREGVSMSFLVRKVVLERAYFCFLVFWLTYQQRSRTSSAQPTLSTENSECEWLCGSIAAAACCVGFSCHIPA